VIMECATCLWDARRVVLVSRLNLPPWNLRQQLIHSGLLLALWPLGTVEPALYGHTRLALCKHLLDCVERGPRLHRKHAHAVEGRQYALGRVQRWVSGLAPRKVQLRV